MVLFQRKIIYMGMNSQYLVNLGVPTTFAGYVPPGAREERLEDQKINSSVSCEEIRLANNKATRLFGILVRRKELEIVRPQKDPDTIVLYLQGSLRNNVHHSEH